MFLTFLPPILETNQPLTGDRYVSATGNDSADGLSRDTAWATFTKLNTWIASLTTGTYSAVILAGDYTLTDGISFGNNSAVTLTLDFEEGVTVDTSSAATKEDGFDIQNAPTSYVTINLRGAQFTGNSVSSANGIGTTNNVNLVVNGAAADGSKATFTSYDDGASFHGTSGSASAIQINDCLFTNCTKSAFAHVNSACGTFARCRFEGRSGATIGIGDNQSTVPSVYTDCQFIPAGAGQGVFFSGDTLTNCQIGTISTAATFGNFSARGAIATDCFINSGGDGPGIWQMTRCYGYFDFRIRGTSSVSSLFENCVFEGRTNTTDFAAGTFDGGGGLWLGGSAVFRNTILYDFDEVFKFASTTQRDHMNANWQVTNCALFENNTNFQSGLTLGTNLVTTNPLLGSRATESQADWCIGSGSPCIGAGVSGANIGFALSDL